MKYHAASVLALANALALSNATGIAHASLATDGRPVEETASVVLKSQATSVRRSVPVTTSGWINLGNSSHRISWAQGTTAAVVATAIAGGLGIAGCGKACVIGAIGSGALGVLASASSGGTVTVTTRMNQPIVGSPTIEYTWRFKANTGDTYGPFIYLDMPGMQAARNDTEKNM